MAKAQDGGQAGAIADRVRHRGEPARNPTVQLVVVQRLVMRLMRLAAYRAIFGRGEHRVAAAAVAPAIGHVGIEIERLPTGNEIPPIGQLAGIRQRLIHRLGGNKDVAGPGKMLIEHFVRVQNELVHAASLAASEYAATSSQVLWY